MTGRFDRPLVLTMGEPAGVGGEIALRAWRRRAEGLPVFVVIDDVDRLKRLAATLGWPVPIREVATAADGAAVFASALPVVHRPLARASVPGHPDVANAPRVIAAIETAVAMVRSGEAAAVVTNPIHKKALYDAGFRFPGHTEFLAELSGGRAEPVMMLAGPTLRVVPVTVHMSLKRAIERLSKEIIVRAAVSTEAALRQDFGLARPRLAVAGLNPHAGEDGALGREDIETVAPAVSELRARGIDAFGPVPPDALFTLRARAGYDVAVCMYHDQALIPLKALEVEEGVNVTLGLPLIRTSPDHGTALDIAGHGRASESSLIAALKLAAEIAVRRAGPAG